MMAVDRNDVLRALKGRISKTRAAAQASHSQCAVRHPIDQGGGPLGILNLIPFAEDPLFYDARILVPGLVAAQYRKNTPGQREPPGGALGACSHRHCSTTFQ